MAPRPREISEALYKEVTPGLKPILLINILTVYYIVQRILITDNYTVDKVRTDRNDNQEAVLKDEIG